MQEQVKHLFLIPFNTTLTILGKLGQPISNLVSSYSQQPIEKMSTSSEDRLSSLLKDIIQDIRNRLPLKDALRTNVLSSSWRYEWINLSHLMFDTYNFPLVKNQIRSEYYTKIASIVDRVLLLHRGPIHKFKLLADIVCCPQIDTWILFVSRSGIREFILENFNDNHLYKIPSCLFSCEEIVNLELHNCDLIPPASFGGFNKLGTLFLQRVRTDGLEKLIADCPNLSKLTLVHVFGGAHLNISAAKLVELTIHGSEFKDIYFEKTPILSSASIHLYETSGTIRKVINILSRVPNVRSFEFLRHASKIIPEGDVPSRLRTECKILYLSINIDFEDMRETMGALSLCRSSPCLQKIDIMVSSMSGKDNWKMLSVEKFWEEQDLNGLFSRLKVVNVIDFTGSTAQLKFLEYVLANAPVLEMIHITMQYQKMADAMDILTKTNRFRRISAKAVLRLALLVVCFIIR